VNGKSTGLKKLKFSEENEVHGAVASLLGCQGSCLETGFFSKSGGMLLSQEEEEKKRHKREGTPMVVS